MKTIASTLICLLIAGAIVLAQDKAPRPFQIKSGIIEYKYYGDKTGTETQYFDDYGMKSAMYSDLTQNGQPVRSWVVSSGDFQYMWDPSKPGQGMKMKNPLLTWMAEDSTGDLESFTASTYEKMGLVKSGTETFLGKTCDLFKGSMGRVLIWKGILMLAEFKMGSYVSKQEATSVKSDMPVEGKYFVIPKNITFSEMPGF